jgi:NADPH:quinone reductase-like Zn-dependent oxidoreductase
VPGLDLAGTVVECGPNVTRFRVGDAVFGVGDGSFAEYARAREDKLAHAPTTLPLEGAALLGVSGSTALQALDAGSLRPGERVLVIGASGGVGTYAVQIAKALGAEVTGVCSAEKMDLVRALGADDVIDYRSRDFADGSKTYDLVLDVGGRVGAGRPGVVVDSRRP